VDPVAGEQYALVVSYLPIPEPSTAALVGLFALGAFARRRRLRRQRGDEAGAGGDLADGRRPAPRFRDTW